MVRQLGLIVVSFLVLFGLQMAHAGNGPYDLDGRFGFGVGGGIHQSLGGESLENAGSEEFMAAAWFRYHMSSAWSLELAFDHFAYDKHKTFDLTTRNSNLSLSVGYRAWATERSKMLMQIGVGVLNSGNVVHSPSAALIAGRKSLGLKLRLAYEYMLARDWAFNLSADYHYAEVGQDDDVNDLGDYQILSPMVGITYYFGSGASAPADSDGDGISDDMDKCSGTKAGEAVGPDGCPAQKAAAITDADYDGVADGDDRCPGTKMGVKVNSFGCAAEEKVEFKLDVKFASGKAVVADKYKMALSEFAAFMQKYPKSTAEIAGYTDNTGKESYNVHISQKRADAVRNYLVKNFGIAGDRLTAKGYGPADPIADNSTRAGRGENRRVVASVQSGE